jgi:hypothetical protein
MGFEERNLGGGTEPISIASCRDWIFPRIISAPSHQSLLFGVVGSLGHREPAAYAYGLWFPGCGFGREKSVAAKRRFHYSLYFD